MPRPQTTRKYEILKNAVEFIFSIGYSNTSPQIIAKKMNIDYKGISKQVIEAFIGFVNRTSIVALHEMEKTVRERERAKTKISKQKQII